MKSFRFVLASFLALVFLPLVYAQETPQFTEDLSLQAVEVPNYVLVGNEVTFVVTVGSSSGENLKGVVQVYDEGLGQFIGAEQAVSVLAGQTDSVFFAYVLDEKTSNRDFNVRVIPNDPTGDDPSNNTQKVSVYVDVDSDGDGTGNQSDTDDDNDEVLDSDDAFPRDPNESIDTDGDGIGDNTDEDDDNDGVGDAEDAFPLDGSETVDTDGDGTGDNSDAFPEDPTEQKDSDEDGLGDNADEYDDNKGPVVVLSTEETVVPTHTAIPFHAIESFDPDGELQRYLWDFGDGETAEGVSVEHTYRKSGDYVVSLTVTDDIGETRTQTLDMNVIHKWQVYVLGALALLLFLLLVLYWLFSRRKNKDDLPDETEDKVSDLALGAELMSQKKIAKKPAAKKKVATKKKTPNKKSTTKKTSGKKTGGKKWAQNFQWSMTNFQNKNPTFWKLEIG